MSIDNDRMVALTFSCVCRSFDPLLFLRQGLGTFERQGGPGPAVLGTFERQVGSGTAFWTPLNVKLALKWQFWAPLNVKLALDWRFGAPLNVKMALERRQCASGTADPGFGRSRGPVGKLLGPLWGKNTLKVFSTIRGPDRKHLDRYTYTYIHIYIYKQIYIYIYT